MNGAGRARAIGAGVAGGLVAAATVGAGEAVFSWVHAHGAGEWPAIGWALIAYGALGAVAGLGTGLFAAVVGIEGFGLALAGVGGALTFVVGRFHIIRDIFMEQAPRGLVPTLVQVGALVGVVLAGVMLWRALRGADGRRRVLARPVLAGVLVAAAGMAWNAVAFLRPAPPPPAAVARGPAPAGAPNVILLMIDTLRADHLSCYGYAANKTPHIDRLAADGVRFAQAFGQASWTRPAVATILTGLYPSSHGAVHKADILPNRVDTLAEVLQRGGYRTVGFPNNANVSPVFNFQQGFDEYHYLAPSLFFGADEPAAQLAAYNILRLVRERFLARSVDVHNYYQPADVVTAAARGWIDARRAGEPPFFLFLHYMDPHDPYMVHPFNGEGYARVANPNPPADVAAKYRALYDGEISYLDTHLGALFDYLQTRGLYDQTLLVLTADHGEEFQEHGGWWHGTTLYDEQIHIPLIMKPARGGAGGRVADELATQLDIASTVLGVAGIPIPETYQGHPLPLDGGAPPARQTVFSEEDLEGNVLQAVRSREWKFITANPGNPRGLNPEELYDLPTDPGEKKNVVQRTPAEAEQMRAELGKSVLQARAHAGGSEQAGGDAATQERLRALGYVN